MPREYYMLAYLQGGFASVTLTSGEQVLLIFGDPMLAERCLAQFAAAGRGPVAMMKWTEEKETLRSRITTMLEEQSVNGVTLVFPDEGLYWPLIEALQL